MNIQIFGKGKCFDTKKAQRFFKERGIKFQLVDLDKYGISKGEFNKVKNAIKDLDKLLDKSSKNYEKSFVDYLDCEESKIEKILEYPTILKTPIVVNGREVTVGYEPDTWKSWS